MSRLLIVPLIVLALLDSASGASLLERISKSEGTSATQIFLAFDHIPEFATTQTGKRFDLVMADTEPNEQLALFDGNERIVKALLLPDKGRTVLSLFFRYPPQDVEVLKNNEDSLVINVLPGNKFTKTYQELSSRLDGISVIREQAEDFSNPLSNSPYAHDWKTFFTSYEAPATVHARVRITVPSFPLIRFILPDQQQDISFISPEAFLLAKAGSWAEIIPLLERDLRTAGTGDIRTLLALTYGEILLRLGDYDNAYKQLHLLEQAYPDDRIGMLASYLTSLLLADNGDPYTANFRLRTLGKRLAPHHPLAPHHLLSLAETSLATGQIEHLEEALDRDDIAYPARLEPLRELRQADLLYAKGKSVGAYVAYSMASRRLALEDHPYSLAGMCNTLYEQKFYERSIECYRKLFDRIEDRDQQGLISYRIAMAEVNTAADPTRYINTLGTIEETFPGTEAAFRAALKKTDLRFLKDPAWLATAINYYKALADRSVYRAVSEEGYFKEALLYHLDGDDPRAIDLLMTFLRDFRTSRLRSSGEALLLQMLPGELQRLIGSEEFVKALELARQNRRFFDNGWLDGGLLADLAYSYERLGIHEEALQLYLYILGIAADNEREQYYLPLTRIAYNKGDYFLVEDFASQYLFNYPDGRYKDEIQLLRLNALYAGGQIDKAYSLIPEPLPETREFRAIAATLAFSKTKYAQVVDLLEPLQAGEEPLSGRLLFILAESLFNLDRLAEAQPLYRAAGEQIEYRDQSLFRLAQISRRGGDETEALKIFTTISETADNPMWQKFAERELHLSQLTKNL